MKQYLLSMHYVDGQPEPDAETIQQMYGDVEALNDEMQQQGAWVFAGGLEKPHVATVVREQDGQIVTTDGSFPEAKGAPRRLLGHQGRRRRRGDEVG
jgi:hypothetical protein